MTTVSVGSWYQWKPDSPYTTQDPFEVLDYAISESWRSGKHTVWIRYRGDRDGLERYVRIRDIENDARSWPVDNTA